VPQELLPAMPPIVAREAVETSTGNHRPCGFSARFSSSSTMPGSTTQRRFGASISMIRFRCFDVSMTSASFTAWPDCEVPPPRGSTLRPSSRAIASTAASESTLRGTTTPTGSIW
jgi:hypothetical protein